GARAARDVPAGAVRLRWCRTGTAPSPGRVPTLARGPAAARRYVPGQWPGRPAGDAAARCWQAADHGTRAVRATHLPRARQGGRADHDERPPAAAVRLGDRAARQWAG